MKDHRAKFEQLLDILERAMNRLASVHTHPYDFGTGVKLHRAEIHTVQAIGDHEGVNVTRLAEIMGVTKGAASQMIGKLVKKGLVKKTQTGDNAKEIHLELTAKGRVGHRNHSALHMAMYDLVKEYFGPRFDKKLNRFLEVMTDLDEILNLYERRKVKEHAGN